MWRNVFALLLFCSACEGARQPDSIRTVAAFEVPLPTAAERVEFLALLRREAEAKGYHLDAGTEEELQSLSDVSPMTLHAGVWRGKDDEENV